MSATFCNLGGRSMPTQKLTDKTLKGLKAPASGQVDYWDELLPGFGVRVGTSGRKSFFVWTRINGKPRRITIKPPYAEDGDLAKARKQRRSSWPMLTAVSVLR